MQTLLVAEVAVGAACSAWAATRYVGRKFEPAGVKSAASRGRRRRRYVVALVVVGWVVWLTSCVAAAASRLSAAVDKLEITCLKRLWKDPPDS